MRNDSSESRAAISSSFTFASAQRSSAINVSPERANEITSWAERSTARAEREFRENREHWTNRKYGELLARDGGRLSLRPPGSIDDRKAHLMRAADHMVRRAHADRIADIHHTAQKLLTGKTLEIGKNERGR